MDLKTSQTLTRAIVACSTGGGDVSSIEALSSELGLSSSHLRRLFISHVGVSPLQFSQLCRLEQGAALLRQGASILEASETLGLSSPSRLYDTFVKFEAMTPGAYKEGGKGVGIAWDITPCSLGLMGIATSERGILALWFSDGAKEAESYLRSLWPKAEFEQSRAAITPYVDEIVARLAGKEASKVLPLALVGTSFQLQVWKALLSIPSGACCSYSMLSRFIGRPTATRATASAIARNPIAYLIPCHRVITARGVLGNYRWGPERKRILLALEQAQKENAQDT